MGFWGPFCFGLVIGWVTYRTLRRKTEGAALGDIASVLGAVGGATIVALFKNSAFDDYCVGLAVGFFAYFVVGFLVGLRKGGSGESANAWMEYRDQQ
jgi:uncharacterized membrane protein YeaQ/YmgE (transglycosylase-associated protein family)